jgi:hypothetical protein
LAADHYSALILQLGKAEHRKLQENPQKKGEYPELLEY